MKQEGQAVQFKDKTVIVTGAAGGLGLAIAEAFVAEGARVAVVDVDRRGREVAEMLGRRGVAMFVGADVSDAFKVEDAVRLTVHTFGGVDILVNAAAAGVAGSALTVAPADWQRVLEVNLTGVYLFSQACVPEMEQRGGGVIVNISSVQGLIAEPDNAAYIASQGGLIALTRSMALDFAPLNIRVNALCSGVIADHSDSEQVRPDRADSYALGRPGRPEEVARAALFLASEAASFITGAVLPVDGGLSAAISTISIGSRS